MKGDAINPMDRPCCANCQCLMIRNNISSRELEIILDYQCPHREKYEKSEISSLFDFVCNSWACRGEPLNYDETDEAQGEKK